MYQPPAQVSTTSLYNPYSTQYPTQYPTSLPFFSPFTHVQPPRISPVQELPPPPPDLTSITPDVASRAIQRLISSELREAGFNSAQLDAMKRIELELVAFVQRLFDSAHGYANLANRGGAIATDLVLACSEFRLTPETLRNVTSRAKKRARKGSTTISAPTLIPAPSRSPSPDLLSSDDEGIQKMLPLTLRMLPSHFPDLPPKHTYLRTPVALTKKAALPSLEKKLKTASLVQESLKNLMLATEDSTNQEEGELFGHIVNWELGAHPRKRWKVSKVKDTYH